MTLIVQLCDYASVQLYSGATCLSVDGHQLRTASDRLPNADIHRRDCRQRRGAAAQLQACFAALYRLAAECGAGGRQQQVEQQHRRELHATSVNDVHRCYFQ